MTSNLENTDKGRKDASSETATMQMAQNILLRHPEYLNNARGLFHNENGKTIIEDVVIRGDKAPCDIRTQYDISSEDLQQIAKEALKSVDDLLFKYDPSVAYEDALTKVIWSKGEGKYAGKVNANTFNLILELIASESSLSKKTASSNDDKEDAEEETTEYELSPGKSIDLNEKQVKHLEKMEDGKVKGLGEGLKRPDVDKILENKRNENTDLEESKEDPKTDNNVNKKQEDTMDKEAMQKGLEALTGAVKLFTAALTTEEDPKAEDTEVKGKEASEDKYASTAAIIEALEVVAGDLEGANDPELFKIAFQIDSICDVLEGKEGATLAGDPDEDYMKKFFKGSVIKSDSDETFMTSEMKGDDTNEVSKALTKTASEKTPPYQIR